MQRPVLAPLLVFFVCGYFGWMLVCTPSPGQSFGKNPRTTSLAVTAFDSRFHRSFSELKRRGKPLSQLNRLYDFDSVVTGKVSMWIRGNRCGDRFIVEGVVSGNKFLQTEEIYYHGLDQFHGVITTIRDISELRYSPVSDMRKTQKFIYYLRKSSRQECTNHVSCYQIIGKQSRDRFSLKDTFGWKYSLEWQLQKRRQAAALRKAVHTSSSITL